MRPVAAAAGTAALAIAARRALRSPAFWVARMPGTTISSPDAAGWVTDFLGAAYFARDPAQRDVDDLRLAFAILTTRWHELGHRRLHAPDVLAFHRAFARARWDTHRSPRGTLDREGLLDGAAQLLGSWFPDAVGDDERRAYGIAFETVAQRDAYRPELRLRHAKLGDPTPAERPLREQVWHTYAPLPVASTAAALAELSQPQRWPDFGTAIGRFTPVRSGGLAGQTFEIEVFTTLLPRAAAIIRAYVSVTKLLLRDAGAQELDAYVADLNEKMLRAGRDEPAPVPGDATAQLALELTTHEGHFMGRGVNRVVLYERDGQAFLRVAGTWDDMPLTLDAAYRSIGREAQTAFWGSAHEDSSMLAQIARRAAQA